MIPINCTPYNEYAVGYALFDSTVTNATITGQQAVYSGTERIGWLLRTQSGIRAFVPARLTRSTNPRSAPFIVLDAKLREAQQLPDAVRRLVDTFPEWTAPADDLHVMSCPDLPAAANYGAFVASSE